VTITADSSRFDLPIDPTRATTFNLRLDFAAEQAYGLLPIVLAYGLRVLSAVFRGL
jgi:hypothetical protein